VIVLDASVLIAHLDSTDAHYSLATERLLEASTQGFGASSITIAEVLVAPTRDGLVAETRKALDDLGVREFTLPPDAAEQLAALRLETALKLPDCCVLLTAASTGGAVLTLDERLVGQARRLGYLYERP
jgi:predicted nucleic acid-binding protein